MQEAGESIGISASTVRSIESKAMRTLRLPRGCGKFKRYFEEYLSAAPIHHIGVESFKQYTCDDSRARRIAEKILDGL